MPVRVWLRGESHPLDGCEREVLPLGAVIVVREEALRGSDWSQRLLQLVGTSPWAPVVADRRALPYLMAILPAGSRLLRAQPPMRLGGPAPRRVTPQSVARLDAPTIEEFVDLIGARLGPVRGALVRAIFAQWGGTERFRRGFRRHGLPLPHDWYDLWLQVFSQSCAHPRDQTESAAARLRGVSVRELSSQSYRLFQMTWREAAALPWTARVERFLRIAGLAGCRGVADVRRSRFNDVRLRRVGNRAGPGRYQPGPRPDPRAGGSSPSAR